MHKKILFFIISLLFFSNITFAQKKITTSEFRIEQLKKQMDYRFVGGFYAFESMFIKSIKYPDYARQNCVIGIMIASFDVDCKGEITDIKLKNALGYKLDDQLSTFIKNTKGHWNPCHDSRYTHFEVPFMFTLEGTETNTDNAAFIYEGESPGFACLSDEYYMKKIKDAMGKKKGRKAKGYIETLIHRDPYNTHYYDLLKEAIEYSGKNKKKK